MQNIRGPLPNVSRGQYRLDVTGSAILDSNGNGTSTVSVGGAREIWTITFISVNAGSTKSPTVQFYRNAPVPGNFISGTFSGNLDVDSSPNVVLRQGELIYAVWSNGDPGAVVYFRIEGTKTVI